MLFNRLLDKNFIVISKVEKDNEKGERQFFSAHIFLSTNAFMMSSVDINQ